MKKGQSLKKKKGKNEKKRKVDVIEVMREYQEEMKKEEEERMRKCEEMHNDKMRRFDRLLDLYEREISKWGLLFGKKMGHPVSIIYCTQQICT